MNVYARQELSKPTVSVSAAVGVGARSVMRYNQACALSHCSTRTRMAQPSGDISYGLLVTVHDLQYVAPRR